MLNLDPNRKLRISGFLPGSLRIWESYQEIQESRSPNRKFKDPGFLPGNSGILDSCRNIQKFSGNQTLGIAVDCSQFPLVSQCTLREKI